MTRFVYMDLSSFFPRVSDSPPRSWDLKRLGDCETFSLSPNSKEWQVQFIFALCLWALECFYQKESA